jgi:hypothetical protein
MNRVRRWLYAIEERVVVVTVESGKLKSNDNLLALSPTLLLVLAGKSNTVENCTLKVLLLQL